MVGVSLDGLITIVLPATSAASDMPARIASGKFHGGITMPAPSGQINHFVMFAGHLHGGFGRRELLHLPRVVFREIDGFADVAVGLGPGLAGFHHQPGVEIKLAFADDGRGADHQFDAPLGRHAAPFGEVSVSVFNGARGQLRRGLVMFAHHLRRFRRIDACQRSPVLCAAPAIQSS